MKIALDWDGTARSDPHGFADVVKVFRKRGHEVFICTMRNPEREPINSDLLKLFRDERGYEIEVYYTDREAKLEYCQRHGINVDVWIDDNPHFLYING